MPRSVQLAIASDNIYMSVLSVQGYQRVNFGLIVGSIDATTGSITSDGSFTGTVTLQRRFADAYWRDVYSWAVAASGNTESITDKPEPESCDYRAGIKTGEYTSGEVVVRIGTS